MLVEEILNAAEELAASRNFVRSAQIHNVIGRNPRVPIGHVTFQILAGDRGNVRTGFPFLRNSVVHSRFETMPRRRSKLVARTHIDGIRIGNWIEGRRDGKPTLKCRIEKTVFIKAPRSIAYGQVTRVLDALKGAGAEPVGLQLDDLN